MAFSSTPECSSLRNLNRTDGGEENCPQTTDGCEVSDAVPDVGSEENISKQSAYMEDTLTRLLGGHPNVGYIRKRGLSWSIEIVEDKATKEPFDPSRRIAQKLADLAISPRYNMMVYSGQGCVDGVQGDHIILALPCIITKKDTDHIVLTVLHVINDFFFELHASRP